jgi:hypothetical protein
VNFFCDLIFDRVADQLSFSSDAELDDKQLEDEAAPEDQTRQR